MPCMSKKINWKHLNPNFVNFNSGKNESPGIDKEKLEIANLLNPNFDKVMFMGRKLTYQQLRNLFNSDTEFLKFVFRYKLKSGHFKHLEDVDSWYVNTVSIFNLNTGGLLNLFRKLWLANRI